MSHVVENLDELAAQFEAIAVVCEHDAPWLEDKLQTAAMWGEARAWRDAAKIAEGRKDEAEEQRKEAA